MDFRALLDSLMTTLGSSFPNIAGSIIILVAGWLAALVIRALVNRSLGAMSVNDRVDKIAGRKIDVQKGAGAIVFYFVLAITLIAFFNTLNLGQVSSPLQSMVDQVLTFVPSLVAGGVLLLAAWLMAVLLRTIVQTALERTTLDERVSKAAGVRPISQTLGRVVYGLTLLLFTPAILDALQLGGLLQPVQSMVEKILGMVPNIASAAVLGGVGWFVARLLRDLVTNLLAATGLDALGTRVGIRGTMPLSSLIGLVVFVFVFVPALIGALDALQIAAISAPATQMLGTFMGALPNLFAAALILGIAFLVAALVGSLLTDLLGGVGFDRVPGKLGLADALPEGMSLSRVAGRVAVFFILLLAVVEAASVLGFGQLSGIATSLIALAGKVLLGAIIIVAGLWLSGLVRDAVARLQRPDSAALAMIVRFAVLALTVAMGLRTMGIAGEIVTLAFALVLGAIAVAFALSFGLGGREAAGRKVEAWLHRSAITGGDSAVSSGGVTPRADAP